MDKIIFLDFDGVMMCGRHAFPSPLHKGFEFYPRSVENLKDLITQTGAKIVVTSTYRRLYKPEILKEKFLAPYALDKHFLGVTPANQGGRGDEIRAFLESHHIQAYVIFDDMPIQGFGDRFFRIHSFEGITKHQIEEAAKVLNR